MVGKRPVKRTWRSGAMSTQVGAPALLLGLDEDAGGVGAEVGLGEGVTHGDFERGFVQTVCRQCGDELRVPFSCKGRAAAHRGRSARCRGAGRDTDAGVQRLHGGEAVARRTRGSDAARSRTASRTRASRPPMHPLGRPLPVTKSVPVGPVLRTRLLGCGLRVQCGEKRESASHVEAGGRDQGAEAGEELCDLAADQAASPGVYGRLRGRQGDGSGRECPTVGLSGGLTSVILDRQGVRRVRQEHLDPIRHDDERTKRELPFGTLASHPAS